MDVSNSKLEFYSRPACKFWTFWRIFMDVKTSVWALTETLWPLLVYEVFSTPNSFSILPLPLKTSYPATTRHYLISSTFMPHSSPNSLLTPITPGSPHTSKHLKPFAGTSSMYTSAPSNPHLEPKPSPISNQPLIDTINLSLLPSRNTTLHSFTSALPTLDTSGE